VSLPDPTRDRQIIRNPASWSMGSVLPMKNFAQLDSADRPTLGCLILGRGLTRVHHVNWYDLAEHVTSHDGIDKLEQTEYATLDEMLEAGWRVD